MSQVESMQTEVERIFASAADAMSDDIVGRLGTTMGDGLMLLDQVSRSEIDKAIPLISDMVKSGDLERVVNLVRVLGAAGDAINDDIVGRLSETMNELLCMADRIARNENIGKLLDLLERDYMVDMIIDLCEAVAVAKADQPATAKGGLFGLLKMAKDPELQQAMQFMLKFSSTFKGS